MGRLSRWAHRITQVLIRGRHTGQSQREILEDATLLAFRREEGTTSPGMQAPPQPRQPGSPLLRAAECAKSWPSRERGSFVPGSWLGLSPRFQLLLFLY